MVKKGWLLFFYYLNGPLDSGMHLNSVIQDYFILQSGNTYKQVRGTVEVINGLETVKAELNTFYIN